MGAHASAGRHRKNRADQTAVRVDANRRHRTVAIDSDGGPAHAEKRAVNPLMAAGAAVVAAASLMAASPGTPVAAAAAVDVKAPVKQPKIQSTRIVLTATSSPLNIPINIAIDILNIPKYEVDGLNYEAAAFLFTGSFWVSNATNVWGTDPGDPPKYLGASMVLLPNPFISKYVGETLSTIAIAELPANSSCATTVCKPFVPFDGQGIVEGLFGKPLPLIAEFFKVPLSSLYDGSYGEFDPKAEGQQSFGGYVPTNPFDSEGHHYDLPGTIDGPNGTYLQPWAGKKPNLTDLTATSYQAYLDHLQADPAKNPVQIPTGQDIARAVTNLLASFVVAFDPLTPGMSYCPNCVWPKEVTPEGIVGALSAADPGNDLIKAWLNNHGWQNSQGAPGDPNPTPSTPNSGTSHQQTNLRFDQIVVHDVKTILGQFFGDYGKPAEENPEPAKTTTSPQPGITNLASGTLTKESPLVQQKTLAPNSALSAPPNNQTMQANTPGGTGKPSFNDRLNNAVTNTIGGLTGANVANSIGLGNAGSNKPGANDTNKPAGGGTNAGNGDTGGAGNTGNGNTGGGNTGGSGNTVGGNTGGSGNTGGGNTGGSGNTGGGKASGNNAGGGNTNNGGGSNTNNGGGNNGGGNNGGGNNGGGGNKGGGGNNDKHSGAKNDNNKNQSKGGSGSGSSHH